MCGDGILLQVCGIEMGKGLICLVSVYRMDAAAAVSNAEQFGCFALEPDIYWVSSQSERDLGR